LFNDPGPGVHISQDDFMAQVFIAAPDYCQSVLNSESRLKGVNLTLDDLETAMMQLWRSTYRKDGNGKEESSGELFLPAKLSKAEVRDSKAVISFAEERLI
jgi:hypothetical protein